MVDPVLTIAAALSVQSPFTSKAHTDYDAMVKYLMLLFNCPASLVIFQEIYYVLCKIMKLVTNIITYIHTTIP